VLLFIRIAIFNVNMLFVDRSPIKGSLPKMSESNYSFRS